MITALAFDEPEPHATGGILGPRYTFVEPGPDAPLRFYPMPGNLRRTASILAAAQAWLSETRDDTIPLSSIKINLGERTIWPS